MKKTSLFILSVINFFACLTPSSLEEIKQFRIDFLTSDSIVSRHAHESGVIEKIQNAPSKDSVNFYWKQFMEHADSIGIITK